MSNQNYITKISEFKESNVFLKKILTLKKKLNVHKVFEDYLTYTPDFNSKCRFS